MTKRKPQVRRCKIYWGPASAGKKRAFWLVAVSDAKKPVSVEGSVFHAIGAHPGVTIGCSLSRTVFDPENASAFPHPVHFASITKSRALLVDKLNKAGTPCHAVRYAHGYGDLTVKNDRRQLAQLVEADPSIVEREFTLSPPSSGGSGKHTSTGTRSGIYTVHRGALARAVEAGLIDKGVAEQVAARGATALLKACEKIPGEMFADMTQRPAEERESK